MGHRAPSLWLVAPFGAGLCIAKLGVLVPVGHLLCSAAAALVLGMVVQRKSAGGAGALLLAGLFFAGMADFQLHAPPIGAWERLPAREAELDVRIDRPFAQKDARRFSTIGRIVGSSTLPDLADRPVYLSATLRKSDAIPIRSAVVRVRGVIDTLPFHPPAGSFEAYLADAGIRFRVNRASIVAEVKPPSGYAKFCTRAAAKCAAVLGEGVQQKRPALVSVYRAMLLGQQSELSDDQRAVFRATGTMHVFSISGLHIGVIAAGLHALLSLLRLPALLRYACGLAILWLYVDVTGAAPSAVRAFVMVALIESALVLRVARNPLSALAAASFLVLLVEPMQLFSASFQMSYGIVAALLMLGLPLADAWQERLALFRHLPSATWGPVRKAADSLWRGIVSASAIGFAASLVGAIAGITFFQLFTPGAFVANLWLIPASTGVLLMGLISLLCGLAGFSAGAVLANHAAVLLLWGIDRGVEFVTKLPAVWFNGTFKAPWIGDIAFVALLAVLAAGYARNWTGWHRFYWLPMTLVAATLVLGVDFT